MISKYTREKSGFYYVNVPTGRRTPSGKPEYKKLRAKTIKALDQKVEDYKREQLLGLSGEKLTVDEWFEQWFNAYKTARRQTTQQWYLCNYRNHISPALGSCMLSSVTEAQCQAVLTTAAKDHAAGTIDGLRVLMSGLFGAAARNHMIPFNPAAHLDVKIGTPEEPRRALTPDERRDILDQIKAERERPSSPWDVGSFAAFCYFFGLRRGEALALTGDDIDDDVIHVRRSVANHGGKPVVQNVTKTPAGIRDIPIPEAAREYIDFKAMRAKGDELLFSYKGKPCGLSLTDDGWRRFIRAALGSDTEITPHYLRHNYCCMLFENGVALPSAQYYMGHGASKTTLDIYTHFTASLRSDDASKIAGLKM